ncbi:MAG: cation transporter [Clostridia bacterium]|nr:cation transporter [Clostridia bacterium]
MSEKTSENLNTLSAPRDRTIIRTGIIGIAVNVLLAAFKAAVGLATRSIAITTDAVNNISDAASSVITIIGTKYAGKPADKKHPFGHGRAEYLSAMVISVLVLYAGITAFVESVKKIIHPVTPEYSTASLIIVVAAIVTKILLGFFVKRTGEKVNSDSLVNSGKDALLDSVISASTLAAAIVFLVFHISVEAWLGAVIGVIIVKSGIDMLRETLSKILGESADAELAKNIKSTVLSFPEISGAYDLVLHNYGPETYTGSVHIEIPDTLSADDLDKLIRKVTVEVYEKYDVILTGVGIYSVNTKNPAAIEARERVREIVMNIPNILELHGFYLDENEKTIRFDIVISFDAGDRNAVYKEVCEKVGAEFPGYTLQIVMDTDYTAE